MAHVFSPIIKNLLISNKYKAHLHKAGFTTVSEVFLSSPASLARRTRLSSREVEDVLDALTALLCPRPFTVASVASSSSPQSRSGDAITLGNPQLDSLLGGGGARLGLVTEVAGESATGKSHLCLHLALNVQLSLQRGGVEGGCIVLCSEGAFPSGRLQDLAFSLMKKVEPGRDVIAGAEQMMDNVHLLRGEDVESLIHALHYGIPARIKQIAAENRDTRPHLNGTHAPLPIRLLIVDSLAAPVRASASGSSTMSMVQRSKDLNTISDALKHLAVTHHLAVVVVNQVTDVFDRLPQGPEIEARWRAFASEPHPYSSFPTALPSSSTAPLPFSTAMSHIARAGDDDAFADPPPAWELLYSTQADFFTGRARTLRKEAALGLVWANAINVRLMLHKTGRRVGALDEGEVRIARAVFGPFVEADPMDGIGVNYTVDRAGWRVLESERVPATDTAMGGREGRELGTEGEEADEEAALWGDFEGEIDVAMMDAAEVQAATQSTGSRGRASSP